MVGRTLIDPTLVIKQITPSKLVWSKLNLIFIMFNIIIPILFFIFVCFFLKASYDEKNMEPLETLEI